MRSLVWITLVIAAAAYICGPLVDPDLWWHITIGRWIIAHKEVPYVDHWTLFGHGQPWRAYSWSIEILFATTELFAGLFGLMVLKVIMTMALAFSAQYVFSKISRSFAFGSLLATVYTVSCFNHITLRPQTFIWMLFIWVLFTSHSICRHGASRGRYLALTIFMCAWANIHISSILGLALIAAWIAEPGKYRLALNAVIAGFIGTLVTPYLGGEWLTFFSTSSHPFSFSQISEFQPATILQYSTAFPLLMVASIASVGQYYLSKQPLARWLLAAIFLVGGLAVLKFIPFLMIILAALLAELWAEIEDKNTSPVLEGISRLIQQIERIPAEGLSFLLLCLAVVYLKGPLASPVNTDVTPVSTMDFLLERNLPFPILNPFGQGGYVMYRLSDLNGELPHLPSIDGRTNLISKEHWDMHNSTLLGGHGWEKYIEAVEPKTILWKAESPLVSILRNNSAWCHIFLAGDYTQGYVLFLNREDFEKRRGEFNADNCR